MALDLPGNAAIAYIPVDVSSDEFTSDIIRGTAERLIGSKDTRENARELGEKLLSAGGAETIIREINS